MDYKYVRAWGQSLGSHGYYIEEQIANAKKDNAPQTAIYKRQDGTWATFEEIKRDDTKEEIIRLVENMK